MSDPWKRKEVIGDCTLYLGDCREVVPALPKFYALVTDPPYGIGIAKNPVRQAHSKKDWDNAVPESSFISELLSTSEAHIIWGGNYFGLPASQCFLVWDKKQPEDFSLAMCEMAWTSIKKPAKIWRQSVLSYEKHHPTQKPTPLMKWCVGMLPKATGTIFDPFMGSGTTGVACAELARPFVGIEMDATYFDVACERIARAYEQPDIFVEALKPPEQVGMDF